MIADDEVSGVIQIQTTDTCMWLLNGKLLSTLWVPMEQRDVPPIGRHGDAPANIIAGAVVVYNLPAALQQPADRATCRSSYGRHRLTGTPLQVVSSPSVTVARKERKTAVPIRSVPSQLSVERVCIQIVASRTHSFIQRSRLCTEAWSPPAALTARARGRLQSAWMHVLQMVGFLLFLYDNKV